MEGKKVYTVREVAQMLSTSEETVRRWIREGKLVAHHESRKEGNQITDEALKDFFSKNKKYQRVAFKVGAMAGLALFPGIGPVASAVASAVAGTQIAADKAMIDRAQKAYEKNLPAPASNDKQTGTGIGSEQTAQNLVKNIQEGLAQIQSRLKSARERRQQVEREIEDLESQEQLAQNTLKIAEQTLANISKLSAQGKDFEHG